MEIERMSDGSIRVKIDGNPTPEQLAQWEDLWESENQSKAPSASDGKIEINNEHELALVMSIFNRYR